MKKLGTGMTAVSLAGHDTGKRYMIMKAEIIRKTMIHYT